MIRMTRLIRSFPFHALAHMKRKMKGFGLGARTDGEGKLGQLRKKKVNTVKSRWGLKRSTRKKTDEPSPVKRRPSYDVLNLKIADIKITGRRRALKPAKINELAESIASLGLQSPITVRLVKRDLGWGKAKTEWVLVNGLHRMEAMKQLGQKKIPRFIIAGGKRVARCRR
jgi:sulfiredoxin